MESAPRRKRTPHATTLTSAGAYGQRYGPGPIDPKKGLTHDGRSSRPRSMGDGSRSKRPMSIDRPLTLAHNLSSLIPGAASAAPVAPESEWIVSLPPGPDVATRARAVAKEVGQAPDRIYEHALVGGFSFRGPAQAAAQLKRRPGVRWVVKSVPVPLVAEDLPTGVRRIDARHPTDAGMPMMPATEAPEFPSRSWTPASISTTRT